MVDNRNVYLIGQLGALLVEGLDLEGKVLGGLVDGQEGLAEDSEHLVLAARDDGHEVDKLPADLDLEARPAVQLIEGDSRIEGMSSCNTNVVDKHN